ncbi:hypothetical protein RKE30_14560 [Streptomyces sp. Li-HN-5-11]|uniref:hypothetical protein n=1 Tax=Streptomyces sp. Li-HN-5-11 TaxID=3075432 RepID=UPI0028A70AD3|nr:hypothetical protein [Streptomyces sp. Li-HN-5-11]WNM31543.1 hypothetical protein RKE30_14560 [Streptomyces sp. Li-HN-5-11]
MPDRRYKHYIEEVRAETGMEPAWPPSADRRLGDVGVFRKGIFERKGTLKTLFGIDFKSRPSRRNKTTYHGDSKGSVKVHLNMTIGADAALVTADGSMVVEFGRANAVLFRAAGCRTQEIEDIEAVEKRMVELHARKEWPRNHVVITEVTHAERTTVLMSVEGNDRVALRAGAAPGAGGLDLLTASGGLEWAGGTTASTQILSEGSLTPLYQARGMLWHPFRKAEPGFLDQPTGDARGDDGVGPGQWYVDEVSSLDHDSDDA